MIPPSRFGIALAVETGRMMVATQSMADKDRVTSVLIELAIGFNHQVKTRECLTAPVPGPRQNGCILGIRFRPSLF